MHVSGQMRYLVGGWVGVRAEPKALARKRQPMAYGLHMGCLWQVACLGEWLAYGLWPAYGQANLGQWPVYGLWLAYGLPWLVYGMCRFCVSS